VGFAFVNTFGIALYYSAGAARGVCLYSISAGFADVASNDNAHGHNASNTHGVR